MSQNYKSPKVKVHVGVRLLKPAKQHGYATVLKLFRSRRRFKRSLVSLSIKTSKAQQVKYRSMSDADMDSIPRVRWSPRNNRFHYNMPVAAEPGEDGFVLMQELEHADSPNSAKLPPNERHHLEEMERINGLIHDVENSVHLRETVKKLEQQRMHHEEFHERVVKDDEEKPQALRKKDSFRQQQPKRSYEAQRQKTQRTGRLQQPK